MDLKKIKRLIELLEQSQLTTLEIQEGDTSVKLSRAATNSGTMPIIYPSQISPLLEKEEAIPERKPLIDTNHYVRSPIVGVFYRSTAPDKPALVEIGDHVKEGQVLCIIEAMKIMNQIQADKSGIIKKIMVNNAEPVEFEQALFIIE
jgi:acetyl-CoA carboxylase biotin carboxyl carrier protein